MLLVLLVFTLLVGTTTFSTWWLSYWLDQGSGESTPMLIGNMSTSKQDVNISLNPDLGFYQMIYGMTVVAMVMLILIKSYVFTKATLHASSTLHDTMFKKVRYTLVSI